MLCSGDLDETFAIRYDCGDVRDTRVGGPAPTTTATTMTGTSSAYITSWIESVGLVMLGAIAVGL